MSPTAANEIIAPMEIESTGVSHCKDEDEDEDEEFQPFFSKANQNDQQQDGNDQEEKDEEKNEDGHCENQPLESGISKKQVVTVVSLIFSLALFIFQDFDYKNDDKGQYAGLEPVEWVDLLGKDQDIISKNNENITKLLPDMSNLWGEGDQSNTSLPFCFFDDKKGNLFRQCPDANAYRNSCKSKARTIRSPRGGLPPLQDPDHFIPHLLHLFNNRRVALVGDSISRQWYETLSCRLGMKPKWYPLQAIRRNDKFRFHRLPQRLRDAEQLHNISFVDMANVPKEYKEIGTVHGYSHAGSPKSRDSTAIHNKSGGGPSCQFLNATLDYYHMNRLGESGTDTRKVFEFITNSSDIVIMNIGAHYSEKLDVLDSHLETVMKLCGEYNTNAKRERNSHKKCFYRETLPAHFQFQSKPCGEYLLDHGDEKKRCGPMKSRIASPFNEHVRKYGKAYGVPIVDGSMLMDAWRWHFSDIHDCRHFCQDNEVWDLLHESLLRAAVDDHFYP